jgi:hypothetical protein
VIPLSERIQPNRDMTGKPPPAIQGEGDPHQHNRNSDDELDLHFRCTCNI